MVTPAGDRPLRLLWVTTAADVDGPGRALSALLSYWPSGDALAACALRMASESFRRAIPPGVEVIELGMRGAPDVRVWLRLARLCRAWRPDVLHTQLSRADWIGRTVGRALHLPVVSTIQNIHSRMYAAEFPALLAHLGLFLDRLTLPWAHRVVAVSEGVRRELAATDRRSPVAVIPNGLDLRRADAMLSRGLVRERWQVAGGDRVVGTVARLTPQKGIHDLIDAARLVCNERPQVRFIHMGTGPLAQSIARSLSAGGLGHRLQLVGHVRDPMSLLAGLDLFVLPSLWEGLPIALLEAMAAGLPVVATRVAGIDEVIEDGRSGLLVPPADPAALARAITELVDDDERRRCLGQGARERVRCFDAAPFAARYRDLFLEVLTRRT